jgi:hypothetical protein
MKKLIFTAVILLAFTAATFAQVSATAVATANIVSPIAITKTLDLNFGNIAVGAAAGTVVMDPAGLRTPTNVTLPVITGTVTPATFTVSGTASYTYAITIPAAATTTTISDGAAHTMTVNNWTSTPSGTGTLDGVTGQQTLTVGATLNIGASQASGSYSSSNAGGTGDFTVTVNYN